MSGWNNTNTQNAGFFSYLLPKASTIATYLGGIIIIGVGMGKIPPEKAARMTAIALTSYLLYSRFYSREVNTNTTAPEPVKNLKPAQAQQQAQPIGEPTMPSIREEEEAEAE